MAHAWRNLVRAELGGTRLASRHLLRVDPPADLHRAVAVALVAPLATLVAPLALVSPPVAAAAVPPSISLVAPMTTAATPSVRVATTSLLPAAVATG